VDVHVDADALSLVPRVLHAEVRHLRTYARQVGQSCAARSRDQL
jgi:hypothetical protein